MVVAIGCSMSPIKRSAPVPLTPSFNVSAYTSRHSV